MAQDKSADHALGIVGRVVIVTGGGMGIGKVYSRRLAEAGAKVVGADIAAAESDEVTEGIRVGGGEAVSGTERKVHQAPEPRAKVDI